MGGLLVAAVVVALGAYVGGALARRLVDLPGTAANLRLARTSVALLGAIAGGDIAAHIYNAIHELQLNSRLDRGFGGKLLTSANLFSVTDALHGILFNGILLIALTTVVALIAQRRLGRTGA